MRFINVLFIAAVLLVATSAYAQTNVDGNISTNTTWTLSGSPYIVISPVIVEEGVTLTIEPGVIVRFNRNPWDSIGYESGYLRVRGYLVALGTETDSIIFTLTCPPYFGPV